MSHATQMAPSRAVVGALGGRAREAPPRLLLVAARSIPRQLTCGALALCSCSPTALAQLTKRNGVDGLSTEPARRGSGTRSRAADAGR
jgi:hypothetical protein